MTFDPKAYKGTIDDMFGIAQAKSQFDKAPHDFNAREALADIEYDHVDEASYVGISPEHISHATAVKMAALYDRMYETTVGNIDQIMTDVVEAHGDKVGGLMDLLKGLNVPESVNSRYAAVAKKHKAAYEAEATIEAAQKGDSRAYGVMVKHLGDRFADLKSAYASASPEDLTKLYARFIVGSRNKELYKEFTVEDEEGKPAFDSRKYELYTRHVMQNLDKKKGGIESAARIAEVASQTAYK